MNELINKLYNTFQKRNSLHQSQQTPFRREKMIQIRDDIINLSVEIKNVYPHFSGELFVLKDTLFSQDAYVRGYVFKPKTFTEVYAILKALKYDVDKENDLGFWAYIHPQIIVVSKPLFVDKHYHKSVLNAFIQIEVRLKDIRKRYKPQEKELSGSRLMEAVFTNNEPTFLEFQSRGSDDGKNIQIGFIQIFSGAMTGIRNIPAHGNIEICKEDAVRKLMLARRVM